LEKNNKTMKSDLSEEFLRLVEIMDELREKCPWDKKQTFESIRHLSIEEVRCHSGKGFRKNKK
jgi:XTP/dITP diphosphohydrolase